MSGPAYVLLPPSESKEPGGLPGELPGLFDEYLAEPRRAVIAALADFLNGASPKEASRVLKVRGALLERALEASAVLTGDTVPVLPAWQRYNGVVWRHLEPGTLEVQDVARVLIPSALYGLNAGTDEVADYRLTFKVALPRVGGLAAFWRPALKEAMVLLGDVTLVDLLPKEHSAVLPDEGISASIVRVTFRGSDGEGVVGHDAKAVKGVLARRVLEDGAEAIDGFRWRGWRGRERDDHYEVRSPKHP